MRLLRIADDRRNPLDGNRGTCRRDRGGTRNRGLLGGYGLQDAIHAASHRGKEDRAILVDRDGLHFRQIRIVQRERLAFGRHAVENSVGVGADEHVARGIDCQAHHVALAGLEPSLARAVLRYAIDLAAGARAHVEATLRVKCKRPDVLLAGVEELAGGPVRRNLVHLAFGRGADVQDSVRSDREGKDFDLRGLP